MRSVSYEFRRILANCVAGSFCVPPWLRRSILRACGIPVGDRTRIFSGGLFRQLNVVIGERTFISHRAMFDGSERTTIGRGCSIATGVTFLTSTHQIAVAGIRRAGTEINAPIVVGDGTWIGANVTIFPGVAIGPGCVIGAGSVVTKNCEPDSVYVGVPARRVRGLQPLDGIAPASAMG
jgi:maltose O-acetyltransferase